MREALVRDLSVSIDPKVAADLVDSYEALVGAFQRGDLDDCLRVSGLFVEHALRAVEFIRTGAAPSEIKSVSATVKAIEGDATINESLRFLVPHVAQMAVYELRSKRGAVHVKGVDPRHIDATLAVHAGAWVLAEFLRLYHSSDEQAVAGAMAALMRGHVPFVETIAGERVVTRKVTCDVELLLLLAGAVDEGLDRTTLGRASKHASPRVTEALQRLSRDHYVHEARDGKYHITGPGEQHLAEQVAAQGEILGPFGARR
ncbi:MAG TPA: hypothetical protein VMQ51_07880 [Candidatus Binatia bacterium]|nr:hypothetical protein [Candidatus Binatia bacterium]